MPGAINSSRNSSLLCTFKGLALLPILAISATSAVTIKDVQVPRYVENASASIDFTCEFVRGEMDENLVLRWVHSGDRSPVFTWIPEQDIFQVFGVFEGHVSVDEARKMSSTKSEDLTSKFGVRLRQPTTVHEGTYKCYVTSVANSDERDQQLIIYVNPRDTKLYYNIERHMMTCRIQGVYPVPKVILYRSSKKGDLIEETKYVKREDKKNEDGTYDIVVRKYIAQPPPERFECWTVLDVNYKVLAKAHYTPGEGSILENDSSGIEAGPNGRFIYLIVLWIALTGTLTLLLTL
ncbi:uncharacterized protein LOC111266234 isoform X1 [Varroa jacobsoni]|uniref:Ig-like domain-containing protein n=2 Tax=Varroa TaxID=62624 RepID=A0A7M7MD61_VARDE|nr:uncharacterized protein LOC111247069 [Varroa destructor]XP_022699318.1 uncharacterized protein LOC111266234 isoform X1 [Varroa jacobsoni]